MSKGPWEWRRNSAELAVINCPHCTSQAGGPAMTCCVCGGTRRVRLEGMDQRALDVWERPGCDCGACTAAGPGPKGPTEELIPGQATAPAVIVDDGPADTFAQAFERRARENGAADPGDAQR